MFANMYSAKGDLLHKFTKTTQSTRLLNCRKCKSLGVAGPFAPLNACSPTASYGHHTASKDIGHLGHHHVPTAGAPSPKATFSA